MKKVKIRWHEVHEGEVWVNDPEDVTTDDIDEEGEFIEVVAGTIDVIEVVDEDSGPDPMTAYKERLEG